MSRPRASDRPAHGGGPHVERALAAGEPQRGTGHAAVGGLCDPGDRDGGGLRRRQHREVQHRVEEHRDGGVGAAGVADHDRLAAGDDVGVGHHEAGCRDEAAARGDAAAAQGLDLHGAARPCDGRGLDLGRAGEADGRGGHAAGDAGEDLREAVAVQVGRHAPEEVGRRREHGVDDAQDAGALHELRHERDRPLRERAAQQPQRQDEAGDPDPDSDGLVHRADAEAVRAAAQAHADREPDPLPQQHERDQQPERDRGELQAGLLDELARERRRERSADQQPADGPAEGRDLAERTLAEAAQRGEDQHHERAGGPAGSPDRHGTGADARRRVQRVDPDGGGEHRPDRAL